MTASVPVARPAATWRSPALRATLWDYAHLAVLSSFALAQPLFALLRDSPEFLAARGALPAAGTQAASSQAPSAPRR